MELNTNHLARCIETLKSSIDMLNGAKQESMEYEVFRNAVIKGYELALETSGKLLRKALKQFTGSPRSIDALSFKEVLRDALKYDLLDSAQTVERWFLYRDNRNDTAHDYGISFARDTLSILPSFLSDVQALETILREKFGNA